ncbi:MAG TPA: hypothetical protein PKV20_18555 [Anaerolineae bacterium]|nr:hypothetical protein [Anaerolineae bacterium]
MLRNYRLRLVLLIILLVSVLTKPVLSAPGPFGKLTPENGATGQPLFPAFSWEESAGAVSYEYCYDTIDNDQCDKAWIPVETVFLPPSDLTYNTTYYWQVRAIDAENVRTDADGGDWWSFTTQNPALAVDKALTSQSATPIASGTMLTYTVTATNAGNITQHTVGVSDPLLTPNTRTCPTVGPGGACVLVGRYTVTQADVDAGQIVNTGSARSDEVTVAVTDTVATPIPQHPALAVDKILTSQSATPIASGTMLTYTVTATNAGNITQHTVGVSDPLLTPNTRTCPTVGPGGACVLVGRYTVTQADVDAGQIVNTGSARSDEVTVAVTDTVATPIPQHPALAVDKILTSQSATPIARGTVLTYTITASNAGNVTLSNVNISDPMLTPASKGCSVMAVGVNCVLAGAYVVQESDFMVGKIVNTARVTAAAPNGDPLDPVTDTVTILLVAAPPVANPDQSSGNPIGQVVTVDVLTNDVRGDLPLDPTSVVIVNPPAGSTLSPDGKLLIVPQQGYWTVNPTTGAITFTPLTGFTGNPTPIAYTVADVRSHTSNAATVTVLYTDPPVAVDDVLLGNPVGQPVTMNVVDNDTAAEGRTIDPTSVVIVGAPGDGKTLVAAGEGVWTVNPNTGAITFTPETGFKGNPTPIAYTVKDDQGNISNQATVIVTYTNNPLARNDVSAGNPIGSVVTVAVLNNDVMAPGRTPNPASVQITGTANPGASLVVTGQGVWSVYTVTGVITFTPEASLVGNPTPIAYTMKDDQGNISNAATVTVTYTAPPTAKDDASPGNPIGSTVTVAVLLNDSAAPGRTLNPASVQITGTANPGASLVVTGQGVWSVYTVTGVITFTPEASLVGNPTPIAYTMKDDQGNISNAATVTVTYTAPPTAKDDASPGNPIGSTVTVAVLLNDSAAPGRTLNPASVQISGTTNPGASLVVTGQGVWSVYTVTGAITFTPEASLVGNPTPIAYTMADDQGNVSNAATVTVTYVEPDAQFFVYLPLTVRDWPPIPAKPVLNVINNPDGYGEYTVSWSSAKHATSYILQEAKTSNFSDAVQVYSDTNTSVLLSDRGPTRYYYRVLARNVYGDSSWSNVQAVDVLWEKEPNDEALNQANGPLVSGLTYYGRFSSGADRQDYFFIYLQSAQSVELWLSNIAAGQDYDLTLRNTALQVVGYSGEPGDANEHIRTTTLPAGRYYIQVYNRSGSSSTQAYYLRVAYPAVGFASADPYPPTATLQ